METSDHVCCVGLKGDRLLCFAVKMLVRSVRGSGRRSEAENRGNVRPATRREMVPDLFLTGETCVQMLQYVSQEFS